VCKRDLVVAALLLALAALFFAPVILGGATLVPFDNLFRFPPWRAFAAEFGVTTPYNELASDLLLENYAWKKFIVESLRAREIPLWNPYLFAGVPFLAAGQHSALYPFSILFYLLPLPRAFGIFVALQFALAALTMYAFARVLGLRRFAATLSALTYAFSAFFFVSVTFPMVIAAAAWLPAILACAELVLRAKDSARQIFFALLGAMFIGIQFLAGHIEISMYILIVTAFFAGWRLAAMLWAMGAGHRSSVTRHRSLVSALFALGAMIVIGIALGAVQLVPLYELVQNNFRSGSASYHDVIGWAYPLKQIITFLIPDFFGNPTHHAYVDVFDFSTRAAPNGTIFWGVKNYVEAGAYVGILPLLLALVALIGSRFKVQGSNNLEFETLKPVTWFFATLALVSLLFTFGTPLYAILFFGVPGFNQLHTPFRWVFPYTLSVAVLAGIGAHVLEMRDCKLEIGKWNFQSLISTLSILAGGLILAALVASWFFREQTLAWVDRILRASEMAQGVFDSARMFYSYEFRHLALFAISLIGSGIALGVAGFKVRGSRREIQVIGRQQDEDKQNDCQLPPASSQPTFTSHVSHFTSHAPRLWQLGALVVLIADLFIIGTPFYPRADSRLGEFVPPAVKFLQQDASLYRITSYDAPNEKVFNPNVGMFSGIADIRGYDSIIPKPYAELMGALAPQGELLYNRIAPFYDPAPLDSPIIRLLNVKYVLTTRPLPNAGYTLVYDDEIKIYRNERVLPRAFLVPRARVIPDRAALLAQLQEFDPTREVLLDQDPGVFNTATCAYAPVTIEKYSGSEVIIKSEQACAGWLLLTDSYFPGWLAFIDEKETALYRADYNFRAVYVPAGAHTIRFKYSPVSFRAGAIGSFLGVMMLLLGFAYLAWRRFYRAEIETPVIRVAKNSILPMATSLLMKLIDLAFALLSLRVLGPTGTGRYGWAITVWLLANTLTDFGLGILVTREVSRERAQANRFLTNTIILRVVLWAASLVPVAALTAIYLALFDLTPDTAGALALLMLGMLPSSLAASLAFLFNAYEKFEYRIAVDFTTRLLAVALGVIALLAGYGYVGLAVVSLVTNLFTLTAFYLLVRQTLFVPRWEPDRALVRWMFFESFPLMINNLLSSLFFRIDILILKPFKGDAVVGYYQTAYKFIDALNFIPSNFTLAIFPVLSRMAADSKDAMLRAYILSLKILLWLALPITAGTIFVARELIMIFGGEAYLPDSAIALQVLIWFLPFSFINSVTHYVLIALGQQRFLTKAFIIGVAFNVLANLMVIPPLSYVGAGLTTIFSEIVLLIPFYYSVRKNLAAVPFVSIAWRPIVASSVMGLALWWLIARTGVLLAVPLAGIVYVIVLLAIGALGEDERALLRRLVPRR
jgi:O-antigen/teichoic acid export membrane protein